MSTDFDVERLYIETFSPWSEKTSTSSSLAPNATNVTFVLPDVGCGCAMLARNLLFLAE